MLPEIVQDVFTQTGGGVAIVGHSLQPALVELGELFQGFFIQVLVFFAAAEKKPVQPYILAVVKKETLSGLSVAAGPAGFLVIGLSGKILIHI